jgi:hypothetical protein
MNIFKWGFLIIGACGLGHLGSYFESEVMSFAFVITASTLWGIACSCIDIRSNK